MEKRVEGDEMTREEKKESLYRWCANHACEPKLCRIYDICHRYPGPWDDQHDEVIDEVFEALWEGGVNMFDGDKCEGWVHKTNAEINLKNAEEQLGMEIHLDKDQKAKADYGKEELTLVPRRIIHDICAIRMYGNKKYPEGGPDNWKQVEIERYRNAAYRHFLAYLDEPQGKDKESGFPHLWHLACNIAFLCEMEDGHE